jgi:tetratricopeptide (TPR) repeat protein
MARDRRERFADLRQLLDAVTAIEARRSASEERGLLAALLARVKRWEERAQNAAALAVLRHETETLEVRLSQQEALTDQFAGLADAADRIAILETALQAVRTEFATGLARQQQNLRELVEDRRREEAKAREREEMREAHAALHPPRVKMLPVIGAAVVAAALSAIASVLVLDRVLSPGESAPVPRSIALSPPVSSPPPAAISPVREVAPPATSPSAVAAAPAAPAAPSSAPTVGGATALPSAPGAGAATIAVPPPAPPVEPTAAPAPSVPPTAVATPNAPTPPAPTAAPPAAYLPASADSATAPAAAKAAPPAGPAVPPKKRAHQLLDRGDLSLEKGHADAAVTAFHAALEADPTLAEAHRGLGMAFALQGNDAVAKLEYERYLAANPQAADATEIRAAISELNARSNLGESH